MITFNFDCKLIFVSEQFKKSLNEKLNLKRLNRLLSTFLIKTFSTFLNYLRQEHQ